MVIQLVSIVVNKLYIFYIKNKKIKKIMPGAGPAPESPCQAPGVLGPAPDCSKSKPHP